MCPMSSRRRTGGQALKKSHLHQRRSGFSSAVYLEGRDFAYSRNKMRTRGCRVKPIGEILRFVGHQSFAEFHDAHRVRWYAVIGKYEFSAPEIAAADNSPDRKTLLVWLDESALLNVVPAADPLARLRIIKHSILAVDFMFNLEIARVRSIPMALQRHPHRSIIHLNLPPFTRTRTHAAASRTISRRNISGRKVSNLSSRMGSSGPSRSCPRTNTARSLAGCVLLALA